MLLFFGKKKDNQKKPEVFAMPLCGDISPHSILSCADCISPTHLFVSFDHTQSPHNLCLIVFFFCVVLYFSVFFIILPLLFRHMPLVPWIFLFFSFQTQGVFLFIQKKSTTIQYSCGSHTYKFRCCNNIGIPQNVVLYRISKYILMIFYIFLCFRYLGVFFFLYHFLFLFVFHRRLHMGYICFFFFFYFFIYLPKFS